jgi:hypothetical protein
VIFGAKDDVKDDLVQRESSGRFQSRLSDWGIARMMNEMTLEVNRAFSANQISFIRPWGAAPG